MQIIFMASLILPRIRGITLSGFQPLFDKTVALKMPVGPFLLLGGNAMGKTTTLQAIVFALAGGVDEDIEVDRRLRWNVKHFRQVVNRGQDTEIQLEFELGTTRIAVRRGILSEDVLGFKLNGDGWSHGSQDANQEYQKSVVEAGGYETFSDFRYLVHRVAYLPETRQSLIWDHAAQIRAVMLISSDPKRETRFRELSRRLREIDTEKRHLHVDIGHLEKRIRSHSADHAAPSAPSDVQSEIERIHVASQVIGKALEENARRRWKLVSRIEESQSELFSINAQLEELQENLASTEDAFVLKLLQGVERAAQGVALQKLLVYHLCPYCSRKSALLAKTANTAVSEGNCPICHQNFPSTALREDIGQIRSEIAQLNKRQEQTADEHATLLQNLNELGDQEHKFRLQLDELSGKLPRIREQGPEVDAQDSSSSLKTLELYQARHSNLETAWQEVKRDLDAGFSEFTESSVGRLQSLRDLASDYAHAFLGHECEFVPVRAKDELGTVSFFVPSFAGKERPSPETCSESERFFLDIGFRMALLELAGSISGSRSTFICETPENALDLAYTDNVAKMFGRFVRKGYSLCLTANIQSGGVAKPILSRYAPSQRRKRIFNLLKAGNLSEVQERKLGQFDYQLRKILGGK
jgi:DNA repair exonuclease SbcCD ATPase subunit